MSEAFFEALELPTLDFFLSSGSGTHAVQTAKIMIAFEKLCKDERLRLQGRTKLSNWN